MPTRFPTRLHTAAIMGATVAALLAPTAAHAAPAGRPTGGSEVTSPAEARRVDRVPTPDLEWYQCATGLDCATVRLPLDYDRPHGATVEIALARVQARDQEHKIGTLFVNPGGPGSSGVAMAAEAEYFLSDTLLDQFDVVGFDPRGVANSDRVQCFGSVREQTLAETGFQAAFPMGSQEEQAFIASSEAVGRACSTTGLPLSAAMSTTEAARDMDVLRRAVGDDKLTYLGFSYGTAIGSYYANMFPDRVRAIVVDGVLNPVSWAGTPETADTPLGDRLRSADGSYRALREVLGRCATVGLPTCAFAGGDPMAKFETLAQRLREQPAQLTIPSMDVTITITYATFINLILSDLYDPAGYEYVALDAQAMWEASDPQTPAAQRARAEARLEVAVERVRASFPARDFPYDNSIETFLAVTCTDSLNPKDAGHWPAIAAAADERAPYFGRIWDWSSAPCAGNTWTARDEDAYRGPFTRRTSAPVLVVGNYYDPGTNYDDAVSTAALLPNSRLLSSDSFGHTAYGTSDCVTGSVDRYLRNGDLPPAGTVCKGDIQPFEEPAPGTEARAIRAPAGSQAAKAMTAPAGNGGTKTLPPVTRTGPRPIILVEP